MFKFLYPEYGFLFIIPILILFYNFKINKLSLFYPGLNRFKNISKTNKNVIFEFIFIFGFSGLLILALMRPVKIKDNPEIIDIKQFVDIMILIDFSESMSIKDFEGESRFITAKKSIKEFVGLRQNDRIGLISFAKGVFILSPLTFDHKNLIQKLSDIKIKSINGNISEQHKGSYIASAIGTAVYYMKKNDSKTKLILLLTDGKPEGDNFDIKTVTEIAKQNSIKIYTLGIDKHKNYDKELLKYISEYTGAEFHEINSYYQLSKVMQSINKLEKNKSVITEKNVYKEYYLYLIKLSIIIFIIGLILKYTVFKSLPN